MTLSEGIKNNYSPLFIFLINHIHLALTNVIATIILLGNPSVVVLDSFLSGQNDVRGDSR